MSVVTLEPNNPQDVTGWTNAIGASGSGNGVAESDSGNEWLVIPFDNPGFAATDQILGFGVNCAAGTLMALPAASYASGYQTALSGMTTDASSVVDNLQDDTTTAVTVSGIIDHGGSVNITVIRDLGSPSSVATVRWTITSANLSEQALECSNDGATWTNALQYAAPTLVTPGDWNTYTESSLPVGNWRYWRLSVSSTNGDEGPQSITAAVSDFRIYDIVGHEEDRQPIYFEWPNGSTPLLNPLELPHLEFALTIDGVNPWGVSAISNSILGTIADIVPLGGNGFLWDSPSWDALNVDGQSFGLLVRRPESGNEDKELTRLLQSVLVDVYYQSYGSLQSMSQRLAGLQYVILGAEDSPGAGASGTTRLRAMTGMIQPKQDVQEVELQGDLLGDSNVVSMESEIALEGTLTYDEIGAILASVCGKPTTITLTAGVYQHTFPINVRGASNPQTYSYQYGDLNYAEKVAYWLANDLQVTIEANKNVKGSAKAIAQQITPQDGIDAGAAQVWTLVFTGATGDVTLGYQGAQLTVAANALTASALQTALQALSTVGSGNMLVSGTTLSSGAGTLAVTAASALSGLSLPNLEVVSTADGTVASTISTFAYTTYACIPVGPGDFKMYYDTSYAALGTTQLSQFKSGSFQLGNRFGAIYNVGNPSFAATGDQPMTWMLKPMVAADNVAAAMAADNGTGAYRYVRLAATGPQIGTTGVYHSLTFDTACKVKLLQNFSKKEVVVAREFELAAKFDPAWGQAGVVTIVNGVSSYFGS